MTKIRYLSLLVLLWAGCTTAWGQNTADYDPADPKEPTRPVTPTPEPQDSTTYYTLTLLATEGGSIKSGAGQYAAGKEVTVTANAASTNFQFLGWTDQQGDTLSRALSFSYTMPTGAATLTACYIFVPGEPKEPAKPDIKEPEPEPQDTTTYYTLTLLATEGGSVKSGAGTYAAGTAVTVTANAATTNFRFVGWTDPTGDVISTELSFSYTVQENATLMARYEYVPNEPGEPSKPNEPEQPDPEPEVRYHTLMIQTPEGGTVTAGGQTVSGPQIFQLAEGGTLSLSTKCTTNFTFDGWYVDGTLYNSATSFTFSMDSLDVTIVPHYSYEPGVPTEPKASLTSRNELYMMSTVGLPGETINYPLYMNAVDTIHDISFQMQVPTNMTVDFETAAMSQAARGYTLSYRLIDTAGAKPRRVETDSIATPTDTVEVSYNTYAVELTGGTTPPGNTALLILPITIEEEIDENRYRLWLSQVTVQQSDSTVVSASSRNGAINTAFEEPTSYIYLENLISVGTGQVEISQSAQYSKAKPSSVQLNMDEVVQLLGCSDLSFVTFKGLSDEGTLTSVYTTSQGYWFGRDGYACESSDEKRAVQVDFSTDTQSITLTQRPRAYTSEETDTLQLFFTYKYKYYGYQVVLHIEAGPDVIGDTLVFNKDYVLTADNPLEGSFNMRIESDNILIIEEGGISSSGVTLKEVCLDMNLFEGAYAQIFSHIDPEKITIEGDVSERIYTKGLTWYFLCLPFDCDLSRMKNENGALYAIRYYDGNSRAQSQSSNGNWKNYNVKNDIILAGTGFIYMTDRDAWTRFYSVDNESKLRMFMSKNNDTTLSLAKNESANFAHRGWNLVGNPYTNYYDGGEVSFQNPLTMWNGQTYDACYTRDDNFIIRPGQAFFVQCPKDGEYIGFPGSGRQLTDSLSQTAGAKVRRAKAEGRRLVNLTLASGTFEDHTRVVINESAAASYELSCDASKFLSLKSDVPQLYSLGSDGTKYAINERPLADGKVRLGVYIPAEGSYTLHMTRNDAQRVLLRDSETGQSVDLSDGAYTFQARKGTYANRLSLWIDTDATGITELVAEEGETTPTYYTLDGRPLQGEPVTTGVYLVKTGNTVKKVYVRK